MIRNGKEEDAGTIAKIKIDNWRKTYLNIFPDEFLNNLEINNEKDKYLKNLKNRNVIIYEKEEEPIAYCYYGKRNNTDFQDYGGEVFALYVKNDCQEHGIGTKLLQYAIKDLSKQYKKILLWCAKENYRAISFYKKNGLSIIGEETENIGGKDVEKVALGISINWEENKDEQENLKDRSSHLIKLNKIIEENAKAVNDENGVEILNNVNLYELKRTANYIENEENVAIYANPDLIFFKNEPRKWFKQIINCEKISNIPQKFINYLIKKDVIKTLDKRDTPFRPKNWTKGTDLIEHDDKFKSVTKFYEECPKSPKKWTKRSVPFVQVVELNFQFFYNLNLII